MPSSPANSGPTKLGSVTTQLANGNHIDDAELELQRQLELADQVEIALFSAAKAITSWTQAIAVAQMLVPLSTIVHVCDLLLHVDASSADVRRPCLGRGAAVR